MINAGSMRLHSMPLMLVIAAWCAGTVTGQTIRVCDPDDTPNCDFTNLPDAIASVPEGGSAVIDLLMDAFNEGETLVIDGDRQIEILGNGYKITQSRGTVIEVRSGGLVISDLTIRGGGAGLEAVNGGGIMVRDGASLGLRRCEIVDNRALESGGGVYAEAMASVTFRDCAFRRNEALAGDGGGLYVAGIDYQTNVDRCVFDGNTAAGDGGGLFMGRDAYQGTPSTFYPQARNCAFARNTAGGYGGGAFVLPALSGDPCLREVERVGYVTNCTFKDNSATYAGSIYGHRIADCGSSGAFRVPTILVLNSIIWDNGAAYTGPHPTTFVRCTIDVLELIKASPYCEQCTGFCSSINPRFVFGGSQDSGFSEFRVWPGSVAIDRGFMTSPFGDIAPGSYDLAGNPRLFGTIFGDPSLDLDLGSNELTLEVIDDLNLSLWINGSLPGRLSDTSNWYKGLLPERSALRTTVFDGEFNVWMESDEILDWHQFAVGSGRLNFDPESSGTIKLQLPWVVGFLGGEALSVDLARSVTIEAPYHLIQRGDLRMNGATIVSTDNTGVSISQQVLPGMTGGSVGTVFGPGTFRSESGSPSSYLVRNDGRVVVPDEVRLESGGYLQSGIGTLVLQYRDDLLGEAVDPVLTVDGPVNLAGAVIFDMEGELDELEVGSQFSFLTTGGGFNGPADEFDLVVTQWPGDNRFIVVDQAPALQRGAGSMVGTVLSLDELFASEESLDVAGNRLADMLLVDIDGDGEQDLVLSVDRGPGQEGAIVVLLNQGGGTAWQGFGSYASATLFPVGKEPRGLDAGTIYGTASSGRNDIAVTNLGDGTVSLLRNLSVPGSVLLVEEDVLDLRETSINPNPVDLALGNFDEDPGGYQDVVVSCLDSTIWTFTNPNGIGGLRDGWTVFSKKSVSRPVTRLVPGSDGGGGKKDTKSTAGVTKEGDTVESGKVSPDVVGNGFTIDWTSYPLPTESVPADLVRVDLDGDGQPDIVTANEGGDSFSILSGNSSGGFQSGLLVPFDAGYHSPESVAAGDIDGDGDNDLAVICLGDVDRDGDGTDDDSELVVRVIRNMLVESGSPGLVFDPQESYRGSGPYQVRIEDMNGDGDAEMIVLTSSTGSAFRQNSIFGIGTALLDVRPCPADLDGDGRVQGYDIAYLLGRWGPCAEGCLADLDRNGIVDGSDLNELLQAWGSCDPLVD